MCNKQYITLYTLGYTVYNQQHITLIYSWLYVILTFIIYRVIYHVIYRVIYRVTYRVIYRVTYHVIKRKEK